MTHNHDDDVYEVDLAVGSIFTQTPDDDRAAFEEERESIAEIQDVLREQGIEVDLLSRPGTEVWEGGITHYNDLYVLCLLAAYLENNRKVDAILKRSNKAEEDLDPLLINIWEGEQNTRFAHLLNHQIGNAYYVPVEFETPVWLEPETPEDDLDADEDEELDEEDFLFFGSSIALQRELVELQPLLQKAGVPEKHGAMRALRELKAAADASVSNDLPIIVW